MKKGNLIVGLDVGTTKTCAVVGEIVPVKKTERGFFSDNTDDAMVVDIIGVGNAPSSGVKKGVVINIERTAESIKRAIEEVAAVDREILHVAPMGFTVDGQNGINDPRGMSGIRLEANVRIITGSATSVKNLIKSCQRAGLDILGIMLEPLASAEAILSMEERDMGAGIVDIGGGTANITLFHEGNICYNSVLNVGGGNFTNDIAIGLRVPASEAEKIKKEYGCALLTMVKNNEEIEIAYEDKPGRKIPRQHLIEILQPRAEEVLYLIKEEIVKSGFYGLMTSGIVLTGGAVLLHGMDIMAENILELPVRIGKAKGIKGLTDIVGSPEYVTGVGLVLCGVKESAAERRMNGGGQFSEVKMVIKR
ncbi:MAG: cell division protein FtsA [Nitrospirae bacterium]|nr:cell division protein FtsA [Nitrospirota bacterium]